MEKNEDRYSERGVSSNKDDVKAAIANLDKGIYPGAFCKVMPDGTLSLCNISHADGAGTKSVLAYQYWKETGDLSVWAGIAIDAIVMNLDDLLCVGVTNERIFLTLTIGRNKHVIPGEVTKAIIQGTNDFVNFLNSNFGFSIIFSGGETADVGDLVRTIIVDANMSVTMKRAKVIVPKMRHGDVIVGLHSFGRAKYEKESNSGIRSNGLTSARHDMLLHDYAEKYPETVDPFMKAELVYCGSHSLTEKIKTDTGKIMDFGKFLLSPTRTYAPVVMEILNKIYRKSYIKGIFHCSGGGQTKIKNFLPDSGNLKIVKDNLPDMPVLFKMIHKEAKTPMQQMFQTFNSGIGMDIVVEPKYAQFIIDTAKNFGVGAQITGRCEECDLDDPSLSIVYGSETYDYI